MNYYKINGFPDYVLCQKSERDFCVISNKNGKSKKIGNITKDGHTKISLCEKGVRRDTRLHVIVAEMFVPNPEGKTDVHHIDEDKTNNNPNNLLWVSKAEHRKIHGIGKHFSEEHRKKMREARKGEKNHNYGKHFSEETRKKMSDAKKGKPSPRKGKHHTEESLIKMREAQRGKKHPKRWKPVEQWNKEGVFIARYASLKEASKETGINYQHISACTNGKRKTAGGYRWILGKHYRNWGIR